jgi:hypothetical protein
LGVMGWWEPLLIGLAQMFAIAIAFARLA